MRILVVNGVYIEFFSYSFYFGIYYQVVGVSICSCRNEGRIFQCLLKWYGLFVFLVLIYSGIIDFQSGKGFQ